ncbi:MAG: hypothetical protein ACTSXA_08585 [Candidatus Heimdallarchaeota archaeon]
MENLDGLILDFIHNEIGYGSTLQPKCEFEDLDFEAIKNSDNETIEVAFKYRFDEDGFSMYDKTHTFVGKIQFSKTTEILSWKLEETDTGNAANYKPYKMKKK